ncbi:MAG TPA: 2-phospho-L-lactate transferase CofD family protein [Ktedonobacteraceae bacterium]|nr:2-phospho-L-lactate transferase CofD family protein [Ktedonobacteraceae bacterium]
MICTICGGTGGARLARGLNAVYDPTELTYICNVGDNIRLFGLVICPDIDSILYYLSGAADYDRGWGLCPESFHFLERLRLFYPDAWFGLGDRDLATHVWRTDLLRNGWSLSTVTAREAELCHVQSRILPATDTWIETHVETTSHAQLHYEEYFIRFHCEPPITSVHYKGIEEAVPASGVLEAIESASTILIASSNPVASILPTLALPGVREALARKREYVWAVSPIINGLPLPSGEQLRARSREQLLAALGLPHTPVAVGQLYRDVCAHFVLDERDAVYRRQLEEMGYDVRLLRTDALTFERQVDIAGNLIQLTVKTDLSLLSPNALNVDTARRR